jgi:hypothetical protein
MTEDKGFNECETCPYDGNYCHDADGHHSDRDIYCPKCDRFQSIDILDFLDKIKPMTDSDYRSWKYGDEHTAQEIIAHEKNLWGLAFDPYKCFLFQDPIIVRLLHYAYRKRSHEEFLKHAELMGLTILDSVNMTREEIDEFNRNVMKKRES